MSDSVRPHRRQPIRLPCPWDSSGKNTGVGCHFCLQCMKVKLLSLVRLFVTPWTAAYQAPPSIGFSRQEYWSGVPSPSPNSHTIFDQFYIRMETTLFLKSRHSSGCHANSGRTPTLIHSPSYDLLTIQQITCQYLNYMTLSAFLEVTRNIIK